MRRASILLLLVLLPFTMAPRTSLTDEHAQLQVQVVVSQAQVDPGDRLSVVVQARNATDAVIENAVLEVVLSWTGKPDTLELPRVPRGCRLAKPEEGMVPPQWVLTCALGDLDPGRSATVAFLVIPKADGELVLRGGAFGTTAPGGSPTATVVVGAGAPR